MPKAFDKLLLSANRGAVIALLAAMAIMVFANVALRFLTDHSILWVEEASRYAMVWLTFIGAGPRSEERRVGKEGRIRWMPDPYNQYQTNMQWNHAVEYSNPYPTARL